MTIPDDVRDVIMGALSVLLGRQDFEGEPSERTVNAMNWLDAQPEAPERWEPVTETDQPIACDCGECGRVLYIDEDGALTIEADCGDIQSIQLPPDYVLFRRMEATP